MKSYHEMSKAERQLTHVVDRLSAPFKRVTSSLGVPYFIFCSKLNKEDVHSVVYFSKDKLFRVYDNYGKFDRKPKIKTFKIREKLIEYINITYGEK